MLTLTATYPVQTLYPLQDPELFGIVVGDAAFKRFVQELENQASCLGKLNQPHVVRAYGVVLHREHGYPEYLVFELAQGTLSGLLRIPDREWCLCVCMRVSFLSSLPVLLVIVSLGEYWTKCSLFIILYSVLLSIFSLSLCNSQALYA